MPKVPAELRRRKASRNYGRRIGLPHPLKKFAYTAPFNERQLPYADFPLDHIHAGALYPNSKRGEKAEEFLLRDDWRFATVCKLAGVDVAAPESPKEWVNYLLGGEPESHSSEKLRHKVLQAWAPKLCQLRRASNA